MTVARAREQERLFGTLARCARDELTLALVTGEAGVGKSHLVEVLSAEASARGFGVAVGRCFADARQRAFAPTPAAAKVTLPLLYVGGVMPANTAKLREICPQAMIGQTVGSGHMIQAEVPDQVNAMIDQFLRLS